MRAPLRPQPATAAGVSSPLGGPGGGLVARLVTLEAGFYSFAMTGTRHRREPIAGLPLPAIHVCGAQEGGGFEITDESGAAGSWLGGGSTVLFVKSAAGGATLVTAYLAREPDGPPLELEIRRIDTADAALPQLKLRLDADTAAVAATVSFDIVVHVHGRGAVRFADAALVGRLGPGLWIEALTLASPDRDAAAGIEYKGLRGDGTETPWLGCGETCGTPGSDVPLLGFAVRQRAGGGAARFDCEYAGYFQSGGMAGPVRNGAPCRSPQDNDPLEGLALRVIRRPPRREP